MGSRRTIVALVAAVVVVTQAACTQSTPQAPANAPQESIYARPSPPLEAADLVVAPNGDDGATGTENAPLRTIDAASRKAKPGMTVLVRDGTYTSRVLTTATGTATARIAYVAESSQVKIVGTDGDQEGVWENNGNYVDIVGFDITGPKGIGLYSRGSNVRIMHNRVHDMIGNCIYTQNDDYSLTDIDVVGNVTYDCGHDELDHGIYVSHRRGVVANNISYKSSGFGIQCWHACNDMVIVNNLVFNNHEGGIVIGGETNDKGEGGTVDNSLVANNIAIDNGYNGLRESGDSGPNNRFVNNLLWDNGRNGIYLSTGREQGTINADPKFVNFQPDGSGDYRLQASSPAVDTGTTEKAPQVAIDGTPRPQGNGPDMGPYER